MPPWLCVWHKQHNAERSFDCIHMHPGHVLPQVSYFQHRRRLPSLLLLDRMAAWWCQIVMDAVPLTRVDSTEQLKQPDTPGRGLSRRGSLFRCNSIIDGNELDVREEGLLLLLLSLLS